MAKTYSASSVSQLLKKGDIDALTKTLNHLPAFEIADLLVDQTAENQTMLFSLLSNSLAIQTFEHLSSKTQTWLLQTIPSIKAARLLRALPPYTRTQFLEDLPRDTINELAKLLPNEERIWVLTLLGYPEGTVGRLMTPNYIAIKMEWTVEQVLDHVREYGVSNETIDIIYVINDEGKLLNEINLKEFLFVPRDWEVKRMGRHRLLHLNVNDTDEQAINIFRKHNWVTLPVLDDEGYLLGVVTIDDILRLTNQEATKDIQKIGGMQALREPYMQTPLFELIKKRAGWLIVFFLGSSLTGPVLLFFKEEIAKALILAFFLPVMLSSGGNAGSQATALVVRALTLGEIQLKDWWKVIKREFISGILLGLILATIGFTRIAALNTVFNWYGEYWLQIGLTIALALIGVVLWGTLFGAVLPLILVFLKLDPANSSAPFVSNLISVTGLIIYFLIALVVLKGTLL